jgi:hypothetical protein
MDEDEVCEESAGGQQWHWSFLLLRILAFVASLFGVTGNFLGGIAEDVSEHVNYQMERDQFAAEAGRELESLIEGSEGTDGLGS